jgi:uncharacterized protein YdaU (DUF1376 family)
MHYYPKNPGDYIRDASHLTLLEHGVYNRLLDICYSSEVPLPNEIAKICRLTGAHTRKEREAVSSILDEFFTKTSEGFRHKRVERELVIYHLNAKKSAYAAWCREYRKVSPNGQVMDFESWATLSSDDRQRIIRPSDDDRTIIQPKPETNNQITSPSGEGGVGRPGVMKRGLEDSKINQSPTEEGERGRLRIARKGQPIDNDYLDSLSATYPYANVRQEFAKAQRWCEAKGKTLSRLRFVNWLNNIDPPPTVNGQLNPKSDSFFEGYVRS